MRRVALALLLAQIASCTPVYAQSTQPPHAALTRTAVTVGGTAVVALAGPANGCNISSSVALIIDRVGVAGTAASGTSMLQPANAAPYQCGGVANGTSVSVNCSGGGTCTWTGDRW